jgi:hypothetical protein
VRQADPIFSKAFCTLPETELVEPVGDLLHRGSASDYRASSARIGKFIRQIRNAVGSIFLASSRTPTAVIRGSPPRQ